MDNELMLFDRIEVIKTTINKYGEDNFYLSFSGGKDSTLLHYLLDEAIPGNMIPRVFIDTGIEYLAIKEFVMNLAKNDKRFVIIKPSKPIKRILEIYGYPFKSKEHSKKVDQYWRTHCISDYLARYIDPYNRSRYSCPSKLLYQFTPDNKIHYSHLCCQKLKKEPASLWAKKNHKNIFITGIRKEEGGQRANLKGCIFKDNKGNVIKFHPLLVVTDEWEEWYLKERSIKLCPLYYSPFNFKRTGCKGCPFSLDLQEQLSIMDLYLPKEREQCEFIWKPVYDEYRRLNYRLDMYEQMKLF